MAAHTWDHPAIFEIEAGSDYGTVTCSNLHTCRRTLNISAEDVRERNVPQVEGWRTEMRHGQLHAFCGRCAPERMTTKEGF